MGGRLGLILGLVVVAALVAAGVWAVLGPDEHGDNNSNFPEGIHYICAEKDCGHGFTITVKERAEYNKAHWGRPVPCPKCKRNAKPPVRAARCMHCGKYFPVASNSSNDTCPYCRKPVKP